MLDVFASWEFEQIRTVFEDIGTQEPEKIWESLLRLSRDFTGAIAIEALSSDGEPGERLAELPLPRGPGIHAAVQRTLRTGRREQCGNVFVYSITYRQSVLGAIALEVPGGAVRPDQERRLDLVFFFAGVFFAAAKGAESEALVHRALSACRSQRAEELVEPLPGVIADGQVMQPVIRIARKFAQGDGAVFISGEAGVGKDRIALAMHQVSPRREHDFHEVQLPAMSETLFDAEMWGVVEGAATNTRARNGHFQAAQKGTLFLNEIGDVPLPLQSKLLRVIQKREFNPVGSTKVERCESKIIAATNRDLPRMVREGRFRQDLYDRLNVFSFRVPALREHLEDIPRLARSFAGRKPGRHVTPGALAACLKYSWPGNIRELENRTEKLLFAGDGILTEEALREDLETAGHHDESVGAFQTQDQQVRKAKRESVVEALTRHDGSKKRASAELDICVRALEKQVVEFGLEAIARPNGACEHKFAENEGMN